MEKARCIKVKNTIAVWSEGETPCVERAKVGDRTGRGKGGRGYLGHAGQHESGLAHRHHRPADLEELHDRHQLGLMKGFGVSERAACT